MEALVQTILAEFPTSPSTTHILECVPRLMQEVQKLAIPGAEKKAAVLAALHQIVDGSANTSEMHAFVDATVAPTIDMMVAAYNGTLTAPKTVEEVVQKANCFLQSILAVVALIKKFKLPKLPKAVASVAVSAEIVAEVAKPAEVEVVDAAKVVVEAAVAAEVAVAAVAAVAAEAAKDETKAAAI